MEFEDEFDRAIELEIARSRHYWQWYWWYCRLYDWWYFGKGSR